ncbi:unnamed protein product [Linum tenue]|uniref:Uncharacterized protein n=1 Tax=Linum tenue TaxID=586396 RepID=A0AAV0H809_9ROSI|nr:unnamed protein product [Linum tenue]
MCQGRDHVGGLGSTASRVNLSNNSKSSRTSGMEYESDWVRHGKSSELAAQVIRSATCFMAWSCKIPIGDGYHEFL